MSNQQDHIRDIVWKLQQRGISKGEIDRVVDTLRYSPPVRPDAPKPDKTEASISPIITGIRGTTKQPVNMEGYTGGTGTHTGSDMSGAGDSVGGG